MPELMAFLLFVSVCLILLTGYPVAFALGGTALLFSFIGTSGIRKLFKLIESVILPYGIAI